MCITLFAFRFCAWGLASAKCEKPEYELFAMPGWDDADGGFFKKVLQLVNKYIRKKRIRNSEYLTPYSILLMTITCCKGGAGIKERRRFEFEGSCSCSMLSCYLCSSRD